MRFWATDNENAYWEVPSADCPNEKPKDLLLNFMVFAFVQAIQNHNRPELECGCPSEGLQNKPPKLNRHGASENEFVLVYGLLNRKQEF
jgi:hypothetical protein